MKIQKLIMCGFGPYANRQELDFDKDLEGKNIFVITGNTGAGKTTIFDAINFALFGEASGSDRTGKSLRSDYADADTQTEVELWFSILDKYYYVKRSPQYLKPKQRGEGFTESQPKAELKQLPDGNLITGAETVKKEVTAILGINSEQFRQLVMIPQGEFKRLLISDSDKKEDIFRKIFGTKIFDKVQQILSNNANGLRAEILKIQSFRNEYIKKFDCVEDEELFRIIQSDNPEINSVLSGFEKNIERDTFYQETITKQKDKLEHDLEQLNHEFNMGTENNKKVEEFEEKQKQFAEIKKQETEFNEKERVLLLADRANEIKIGEDKYLEVVQNVQNVKNEVEESQKKWKEYEIQFATAKKELEEEDAKEEYKVALIKQIQGLESLKGRAIEYEKQGLQKEKSKKKITILEGEKISVEEKLKETSALIEELNQELIKINQNKIEKGNLELEDAKKNNIVSQFKALNVDIDQFEVFQKDHEKESDNYKKIEKQFQEAKQNFEQKEIILKQNQAGILAIGLEEGMPCPVCGSSHHPSLARISSSEISQDMVEESKEGYELQRNKFNESLNRTRNIFDNMKLLFEKSILTKAKELFGEEMDQVFFQMNQKIPNCNIDILKTKVQHSLNQFEKERKEIRTNIKLLEKSINLESQILDQKEKAEIQKVELETKCNANASELATEKEVLSVTKSRIQDILKEFNGSIQTEKEINQMEESIKDKHTSLVKAQKIAAEKVKVIQSQIDMESSKHETQKKNLNKLELEQEEKFKLFQNKIIELGFNSEMSYREALLSTDTLQSLKIETEQYRAHYKRIETLYENARQAAEGLKTVELSQIIENMNVLKDEREKITKEHNVIYSRLNLNRGIFNDVYKSTQKIEKQEKEYRLIGHLAKFVNGDNERKMSFERYVLASYFEDIITAANLRFTKMTSNRYELYRKESIGDKRKGQGLDLEVFDNYTGKKRDVKTLSGGESFKASLALALGLADIVQSNTGGIQLDTMFIDEGFGTLDSESLENAIDCLIDLQNDGRIVGIISHVQELKERIETRLEVTLSDRGSKARFVS